MIGAMSGTSADGVDAALVSIEGQGLSLRAQLLDHAYVPYDPPLRAKIRQIRAAGEIKLADLAQMGRELTLAYAEAVKAILAQSGKSAQAIAAVAAHGQTLFHHPPLTLQWFDPALLAWEVNIAVVSDFRRADCAAGGQGAPLVPYADLLLFAHPTQNRILLNVGGIANLTYLRPGAQLADVIAYDTGPGNCLSDRIAQAAYPDGPGYDAAGAGALRGRVIEPVVTRMLSAPYFRQAPPKSTDGPTMVDMWKQALTEEGIAADAVPLIAEGGSPGSCIAGFTQEDPGLPPSAIKERTRDLTGDRSHRDSAFDASIDDLLATASAITSRSILAEIKRLTRPGEKAELIVTGGGAHHGAIMADLSGPDRENRFVLTRNPYDWPPEAKEAVAFALLGAATLDGEPSNVPSATGAKRPVVLGAITPRP